MNKEIVEQAIKKLSENPKKLSRKANAVKDDVILQLMGFCKQNSEFAQAVVQSKGTVADCLESTIKGSGDSISDFDVFNKAVTFWFPGAKVIFSIKLDIGDGGFSNEPEEQAEAPTEQPKKHRIELDFDDLL
ncbi:MAG: hypothetical protein ACI4KA_01735 [Oscillospiraceae bacterium]